MDSVLRMLSDGDFVSGEAMSEALGVTRSAIWKHIRQLQAEGWPIESGGKRGYRLGPHDRLEPDVWQGTLATHAIGQGEVIYAHSLSSTNTVLKKSALEGAAHGTVCLCEEQTAGRGRMGRSWVSEPGAGLWQSVLLRPDMPPGSVSALTFCAALAMSDALKTAAGLDAGIKWPNDLICGGKKICGILLEACVEPQRVDYVVVGVGLNVRPEAVPPDLRGQAGCVADFCAPPPRRVILARYLESLEKWADACGHEGFAPVREALLRRCLTLGRRVKVISAEETYEAEAVDITDRGALTVRTDGGALRQVMAADVSVRGVMGYA
ncbi:MAG: biotin--[Clostridia bacterium]|nr:biotin--[acetyl-CoA-carboxylase] ligase [Clostridia bacterium]